MEKVNHQKEQVKGKMELNNNSFDHIGLNKEQGFVKSKQYFKKIRKKLEIFCTDCGSESK